MSVVLNVEEIGPCRKELKIEIPAPAVEAETARVVGEFGRKASLPGFRKGKVPQSLVQRHFGDDIRREVVERLVPRYFRQAVAEKGIDPLLAPEVEMAKVETGAGMTFIARVEVRPEIELRNYKDFSLPAPPVAATAEEVQTAIADLRLRHAEWKPAERPAATGDRAKIELKPVVASEGDSGSEVVAEAQTVDIEVGSPQIWEEISLAVAGLTVGQGSRFTRKEPRAPRAEREEGDLRPEASAEPAVERTFEVRLVELSEPILPPLDDAFAAHLGKFATVAELEADIARRIGNAKRDDALRQRETAMLDQLTERHPIPLPDGVVHREVDDLLRDYAENLARRGVDLEGAGLDWQRLGEQAKPQAERRVKARFLLDAISAQEKIEVGEEEFEQALALLARAQGIPTPALRQKLDESGQLAGLRAQMRREKTVRRLLGEADAAPAHEHDHAHAHAHDHES
uniref:Trigger factor n=1 Tax=uncultured bacterium A1Q1_fos_2037 TaxID=1256558 RepID=L7VXR7_9BACT|nr:cell division trigger factor [uncultured bacterium A1Q1_fos_2037]